MVDFMMIVFGILVIENLALLIAFGIWMYLRNRWNIDVSILRFVGDKRRPTLIVRKARKVRKGSSVSLYIKGYKNSIRDFQAQYFYPSAKGSFGGLVLFEFKSGWLTPCVPEYRKLPDDMKAKVKAFRSEMNSVGVANFEFDEDTYKTLTFKAIDDVDAEWSLLQQERINSQYSGGWREFLQKYGGHIALIVVAVIILVGFVVYLKEVPSLSGQCIGAGVEAAKNTYLEELAKNAVTGASTAATNVPPG